MEYPELRLSFHPQAGSGDSRYDVELRCSVPGAADEQASEPFPVELDWEALEALRFAPEEYGRSLSGALFKEPGVREALAAALAKAAGYGALRVRLCLTPATRRLHSVLWETLQDPASGAPFSTNERVLISRFLSGGDSRSVRLRPRGALRALVAIANPQGLDNQRVEGRDLAPIPVDAEWARAAASLKSIGVVRLAAPERASLDNLTTKLRDGFDILYLVCHGALVEGEPLLWLENDAGGIDRVSGAKLAQRLGDMREPPRLVVLASCESAGKGPEARSDDKGALAALGPRLAQAGVAAVIAMQSDVRMDTAGVFFPTFFRELLMDGQIDRAVAVARAAIRDCPDWWVPVLITRLKLGRIWSEHGGEAGDFQDQNWVGVVHDLGTNGCTPILGPDLSAPLLGSQVELAHSWAERFEFPMAPQERDSLPQVAQYLAYHPQRTVLERELESHAWRSLVHDFPDKLPPGVTSDRKKTPDLSLADLLTHIWKERLVDNPNDPYWLLAAMPFPVFITTNRDNLLVEALKARGKKPRVEICRWPVFEEALEDDWPPSIFAQEPRFRPDVDNPLVFYAFGHLDYPSTLVLTEDDYFDYLIGITKNTPSVHTGQTGETGTAAIPEVVKTAISRRGLLFLGFRVSDWEFRTLFRRILAQEHSLFTRRSTGAPVHTNVSVQLEPAEGGEYLEPEGARQYLNKYFQPKQVQVYWGRAEQFIQKLHSRWTDAASPRPSKKDLER